MRTTTEKQAAVEALSSLKSIYMRTESPSVKAKTAKVYNELREVYIEEYGLVISCVPSLG